jgi:trigger factor
VNVTIEDEGLPARRIARVVVEGEDLQREEKKILAEVGKAARIPGFRPGKAPRHLLYQRHGDLIRQELRNNLLARGFEGIREQGVVPVQVVDQESPDLDGEPPLEFRLTLDIEPQFELPAYEGLTLHRPTAEVTEEEVEQTLSTLRSQQAEFNPVERAVESGDYVQCSYEGRIDGEPIADEVADHPMYGTQENTWEEAGDEVSPGIPEIAAALVGMNAGETTEVEASFPEDHRVEFLQGKTVTYHLEVKEVRAKVLPELDETFLGNLQVSSVDELRDRIRQSLQSRRHQEQEEAVRNEAVRQLTAMEDFDLPESLVEEETQGALQSHVRQQLQSGVPEEKIHENNEALYASARSSAAQKVKSDFILDRIAEKESVEVAQEDLQHYLQSYTAQTGRPPEELVEEWKKDRQALQRVQSQLRRAKVVSLLVERASIEDAAPAPAGESAG